MRPGLLACLLLPLAGGLAAAQEFPLTHALWIRPAAAPPGEALPGLLTLPPGWSTGDAAVVVLRRRDVAAAGPAALVAALLDAAAAVLELDPGDEPAAPLLAGALEALRGTQGAGLVVAIGFGPLGEAALGAGHIAAGIALDDGRARFRAGPPRPPAEAWPLRAGLLCDLLARQGLAGRAACGAGLR